MNTLPSPPHPKSQAHLPPHAVVEAPRRVIVDEAVAHPEAGADALGDLVFFWGGGIIMALLFGWSNAVGTIRLGIGWLSLVGSWLAFGWT
jgi:hypothetical protein